MMVLASVLCTVPSRATLPTRVVPERMGMTLPGAFPVKNESLFDAPPTALLNAATLHQPSPPRESEPFFSVWAPPGMAWIWDRHADPSLSLTDWSQVLNVARIGMYILPLRSDPAERVNIILAAQSVDGVMVPSGSTFSFNKTVGERTTERGYQDGLMFDQGQIVRGTGGGICLVATGLYNAALQAGLDVRERHAHSGVVSYAAPGCDASVVYGSQDMQFVNTTGQTLVIKTRIDPDRVVVALYGTPPPVGQHILLKTTRLDMIPAPTEQTTDPALPPLASPEVVQKPHAGYNVTVERLWTIGRHVMRREVIACEHRAPRPKIVHVPLPSPVVPEAVVTPSAVPPPGTSDAPSTTATPAPSSISPILPPATPEP